MFDTGPDIKAAADTHPESGAPRLLSPGPDFLARDSQGDQHQIRGLLGQLNPQLTRPGRMIAIDGEDKVQAGKVCGRRLRRISITWGDAPNNATRHPWAAA